MITVGRPAYIAFKDLTPSVVGDCISVTPQGVGICDWMFAEGPDAGVLHLSERFYPFTVIYFVEQNPDIPVLPRAPSFKGVVAHSDGLLVWRP